VHWAVSLPTHVNVNTIEVMPAAQSFAPFRSTASPERRARWR
jgi:3-hydroxy acid dehydrogenase/malonic semialdehyde reductase